MVWPKDFAGTPEVFPQEYPVFSLVQLRDGRLASTDLSGAIKLWPKQGTGEPVILWHGTPRVIATRPLAVLADGRLVSGDFDGKIRLCVEQGTSTSVQCSGDSPPDNPVHAASERRRRASGRRYVPAPPARGTASRFSSISRGISRPGAYDVQ